MSQAGQFEMASHAPPDASLDEASDDELVRRARAGDRPAYGELVRRHQAAALRLAAGVCGSTEEARDIVQDAMVKGYRALDRYRGDAPVRSWLLRIVANDAKNAILDGELVVLDRTGKARFYDLMAGRGTVVFAAFDLMWLNGRDLRDLNAWRRRRPPVETLVAPSGPLR